MTAYGETSTTNPGSKSAAEIEREVKAERAHVEETLDALQDRLSPGQLVDQAVTYLRTGGGADFVRNLGDSVRDNPMPVVLVGVGLAWMMVASSRSGNGQRSSTDWVDDDLDEYEAEYYARTGYGGSDYAYGTGTSASGSVGSGLSEEHGPSWSERAKATAEGAKEMAEDARTRARDAASGAKASVGEMGGRARQAAGEAAASVGEMGSRARERMASARRGFSEGAHQTGAYARRYGRRAQQGFLDTLHEQPLVLGAIGLAVGAALGSILPRSEPEDRLMGETRDRLKHQAEEFGREQLAKAESAAGAAYDAALDEAEKQGLTPEQVKRTAEEAAQAARQKVERVGEAAASAAHSEVKGSGSEEQRDTA